MMQQRRWQNPILHQSFGYQPPSAIAAGVQPPIRQQSSNGARGWAPEASPRGATGAQKVFRDDSRKREGLAGLGTVNDPSLDVAGEASRIVGIARNGDVPQARRLLTLLYTKVHSTDPDFQVSWAYIQNADMQVTALEPASSQNKAVYDASVSSMIQRNEAYDASGQAARDRAVNTAEIDAASKGDAAYAAWIFGQKAGDAFNAAASGAGSTAASSTISGILDALKWPLLAGAGIYLVFKFKK